MKLKDVLKGKSVVNCKTIEEADKLFDATPQLDQIDKKDRQQYNERTAYNPNGFSNGYTYANVEYYEEHGYTIIKFSDIDEFKANETRYFKCTKLLRSEEHFTVGKVYEVTDDKFVSDRGFDYAGGTCPNVESVIKFLKEWYEFEEIKKEEEKVMNKFKVGDMVKGTERGSGYTWTDKKMTKGKVTKSIGEDRIGVEIFEHTSSSGVGRKYEVKADLFDLITPSKKSIHVTFDNDTTHAIVKEDGKVVKREKVGLCRGDVYDEATGVREVIDKLYGKKVVEDAKPKFVKAKVGDTIKLVNQDNNHMPDVKNGDTFKITKVTGTYVGNGENSFGDDREEYVIIDEKSDDKTELWKCVSKDEDACRAFTVGKTYRRYFSNGKMRMDDDSTKAYWVLEPECFSSISFERVDADNKSKSISEYTTDELLSEIKRRMEK